MHDQGKTEALLEILMTESDENLLDPQVLTLLEPKVRARFKEIDTKRIADQHEADLETEGFIVEKDEPFSFITFSSNNFGRTSNEESNQ